MALILSIETSTKICSVALHEGGTLLACNEIFVDKSHAEKITILIAQVLDNAKMAINQLDAIAVSAGPGSYTGLRIASSTAKGLCYALDKPLVAVDTLQALALQLTTEGLICPMIDARRSEVYCALFDTHNTKITATEAKVIDPQSFENELNKNIITFCGDGAAKCKKIILHTNARFVTTINSSASTIGKIAEIKYRNGEFENISSYEPHYLKEFVALHPSKNLLYNK